MVVLERRHLVEKYDMAGVDMRRNKRQPPSFCPGEARMAELVPSQLPASSRGQP